MSEISSCKCVGEAGEEMEQTEAKKMQEKIQNTAEKEKAAESCIQY